ncbi:MAG TPA: hypothetical protein VM869_17015, partial [Enhygromyxa sp.]|nr:hypothetical protein [Enhygromyxa sp.]
IAEHFDKLEFDAKARVSPVGDGALAQAWRDVLRRMGQTKVVLVADPTFDSREPIDPHPALAWAEPHCQLPPILLAGARARSAGDDDRPALEFALARGVYLTRPEVVMVAGQTRAGFAILTSAMLLAFHPRHAQRKQAARNVDDPVGKLGHELGRKLPIRVARQIGTLLKDHEAEPFDSRAFRTWIRRAADRVGLLVCGDLRAALRVLADVDVFADENPTARIAQHPDLVALIGFAVSGAHADARRRLGFVVAGDSTPSERLPAPPIDVELGRRNPASDAESGVPRRRIRADTSRIRLAVAKDAATRESSAPMLAARRTESTPAIAVTAPAVVPSSPVAVPEPRAAEPTPVATPIPVPIPAAEPDGFEELEALDEAVDLELETATAEPSGRGERAHEQAPIDEPELEDGELFDDLDDVDLDLAGELEELEMDDVDVEA